jgi:hypothetical protein
MQKLANTITMLYKIRWLARLTKTPSCRGGDGKNAMCNADNMWLFVPIQAKLKTFLSSMEGYPFQMGSSLSVAGINYRSLKALNVLKELEKTGYISQ